MSVPEPVSRTKNMTQLMSVPKPVTRTKNTTNLY